MGFIAGTHIIASRLGYTHHGIYIGNNQVVHYSGFSEFAKKGRVIKTSIDQFALGGKMSEYRVTFFLRGQKYSNDVIVNRALDYLNEDKYNLIFNNCEHFANWCTHGDHFSSQTAGMAEKNIRMGNYLGTGFDIFDLLNIFKKKK